MKEESTPLPHTMFSFDVVIKTEPVGEANGGAEEEAVLPADDAPPPVFSFGCDTGVKAEPGLELEEDECIPETPRNDEDGVDPRCRWMQDAPPTPDIEEDLVDEDEAIPSRETEVDGSLPPSLEPPTPEDTITTEGADPLAPSEADANERNPMVEEEEHTATNTMAEIGEREEPPAPHDDDNPRRAEEEHIATNITAETDEREMPPAPHDDGNPRAAEEEEQPASPSKEMDETDPIVTIEDEKPLDTEHTTAETERSETKEPPAPDNNNDDPKEDGQPPSEGPQLPPVAEDDEVSLFSACPEDDANHPAMKEKTLTIHGGMFPAPCP